MQTVNGDYRSSDHNRDHYQRPMLKAPAPIPSRWRVVARYAVDAILWAIGFVGFIAGVYALGVVLA